MTASGQLRRRGRRALPDLAGIDVRFRSNFADVEGRYPDGTVDTLEKLCRLRYGGVLHTWGFASTGSATTTTKMTTSPMA